MRLLNGICVFFSPVSMDFQDFMGFFSSPKPDLNGLLKGKHRQPRRNRENKNRGPGCPVSIFKPQKKTLSNDIRLVEPHLKFQPQRNGGWCCWIPFGHSTVCDVEHGHWQLVYRLKTGDFNHNCVSLAEAISISSGKHTKNYGKSPCY